MDTLSEIEFCMENLITENDQREHKNQFQASTAVNVKFFSSFKWLIYNHITRVPTSRIRQICTSAHILGACKTALSQGRNTFRHDSVLTHLVETLKKFIFELPSEPPKKCHKITFLRAWSKARTKSKVSGILHLTKDWKIVADTHSNYVFPSHIAISELKPDLVLYSNDLKRVIIVELTCPCEENMNARHSTKVAKYSCLINVIMVNGWQVDFFAVEVGARGYCARTTIACLKKMGFTNKLAYSTANNLG
ncbi:uncharacterized protein LOC130613593 [Hydractinia symbiolongicarpus]|uniref:uncharacterized protein LOC130613593 n=1 Tax=Hydractinia symbiolongicarpus TaxID=13093 RepID=UPI00254FF1DD|nr:uncharacterized protein LOC130613593 [Hydractinia symbiolongicarpus]